MMETKVRPDPLLCECCRRPEALVVAYDLPTGRFVCPACSARLRRERLRRACEGNDQGSSAPSRHDQ